MSLYIICTAAQRQNIDLKTQQECRQTLHEVMQARIKAVGGGLNGCYEGWAPTNGPTQPPEHHLDMYKNVALTHGKTERVCREGGLPHLHARISNGHCNRQAASPQLPGSSTQPTEPASRDLLKQWIAIGRDRGGSTAKPGCPSPFLSLLGHLSCIHSFHNINSCPVSQRKPFPNSLKRWILLTSL